jgi:hypothetical protein
MLGRLVVLFGVLAAGVTAARADAVLLMEEPINFLGHLTSAGHAALLMEDLCTDDHVSVRRCRVGEAGTVLSRYQGIEGYDWLAIGPVPYLFAVDSLGEFPGEMDRAGLKRLREAYRVEHLEGIAPAGGNGPWIQMVGAAYRRRIICIRVHTTEEQDARLMEWLNGRDNVSHFNLFWENCADFTGEMLNVLFPGAVHRNLWFDAGITTPKQVASGLHGYAKRHPELGWEVSVIPQVPGTIPRSGRLYGVTEAFVKTKPYLLPLGILQPVGIGSVVASALLDRRYSVHSELETAPRLRVGDGTLGEELGLDGGEDSVGGGGR